MRLFMKNTWQLFICLVFLAACSDDAVEDQTTISLPPETEALFEKGLNFTKDADTQSLEFTTTEDWSITAAETRNGEKWYRIYPTSGKAGEKADVSISVDKNETYDERSVAITINAGKVKKTLMISQKQTDALLVSSERMEVKQEGGTIDIEVKANVEYKAVIADDCQNWIKLAPSTTRGLSTSIVRFKIETNGERDKREGTIYITDGKLTKPVKVYQHGGDIILLNENEYPVGDRGETIKVELRSNCTYGIQMPDADWIKEAVMNRGMSSHTIYYTISPNETNESRRAKIIFYNKENTAIADTLTVIQAQKDAVVIDNKSIELKTPNDTIIAIDVNANVDVEVRPADTCQWITESAAARGLQLRKVYLKAAKNENFSPRRGRVLIKSKNGKDCDTLKIWQAGKHTTVKLEKSELDVPMAGGTYRIKIEANVAVKMSKWKLLWPEGELGDEPNNDMTDDSIWSKDLFEYKNKPGIPYQATLSADGQYLEVKVDPAVSAKATSVVVKVYGEYENREAQLTIRQEPDPTKVVQLQLAENGATMFTSICVSSYQALQQMCTLEELYSRQSEKEQGYNRYLDFINHTLNPNNSYVSNAWNACYTAINRSLIINMGLENAVNDDITSSDSTAVVALMEMHRFLLYYEMVNLWGKAVYINKLQIDPYTGMPATLKAELLKLFVEPLLRSRDYLPGEKVTQTTVNDCFFPSRDLPSLLLARIYMEQGDWSKAKSMLAEVTNSGRYQLGDLVYQLPAFQASSGNQNDMVANICFSYTEVLLNLAECEFRLGSSTQAEEYLNKVIVANIGSPAYSSEKLSAAKSGDGFMERLANTWQSQLKGTGTYFAFLKRNGIAEKFLDVPAWRLKFPIPQRELDMNRYMSQNEGY